VTTLAGRPLLDAHWASESGGEGHVVFTAEGIRCANCARSIRRALDALPGVRRVDINVVDGRVSVVWDSGRTSLGAILGRVSQAGFRPVPLVGVAAAAAQREERRAALKRIGLAGIGAMQLMMYAAGLWVGAFQGIDPRIADYLRWTCLLITTPVLAYSGAPILRGGLQDLRRRTLGMDVTVSLALLLAYGASVINTVRGVGEVYYDSVAMFILLLLLGRHVEMRSRHQAASVTDALARSLPTRAQRIDPATGLVSRVPLADIGAGDLLRVASGETIPVDGAVAEGIALVDESLVTGESEPRRRATDEPLLGGSTNAGAAITLRATRRADESTLHGLVRLLERAQGERPRLGIAAERMASWFVARVLVLTMLVGVVWWYVDPERALPAVLAVLVATCPCALSLATPVAIAAATSRLARLGVLVMRADAVEGLAGVDTVLLDKTGTLTVGRPTVRTIRLGGGVVDPTRARAADPLAEHEALAIAAALERGSQHPLALAFRDHADAAIDCADAHEIAGQGVMGTVAGRRWRLGKPAFAAGAASVRHDPIPESTTEGDVMMMDDLGRTASFAVCDALRDDAAATTVALREAGLDVRIASGDRAETVAGVATTLGIHQAEGALTPADKLARLKALQSAGRRVLMVGDGINDGPVLAAADVSMAMGRGSAIAHAAGDLLLLRESLAALPDAVRVARAALQRVRQNLRWAAGYNLAAIPLAALGFMPPWVAALGMSFSSLVVVFNARRPLAGSTAQGHLP
jgi:Cu2+-exporting ATPase